MSRSIIRLVISSMLIFLSFSSHAQIQWAKGIRQYTQGIYDTQSGVDQVIGEPNAVPQGTIHPHSWSVIFTNQDPQFVEVFFEKPVQVRKIFIVENYGIGVKEIFLYDDKGHEKDRFRINEGDTTAASSWRVSRIVFEQPTSYAVRALKVVLYPPFAGTTCQLDAIGISEADAVFQYREAGYYKALADTLAAKELGVARVIRKTEKNASPSKKSADAVKLSLTDETNNELTIAGKLVTDDSLSPVGKHEIMLVGVTNPDTIRCVTAEDGTFSIRAKPADYRLTGSKQGYVALQEKTVSMLGRTAGEITWLDLKVSRLRRQTLLVFYDITFDINAADLQEQSRPALDRLVLTLQKNPSASIQVFVHTDSRGDDAHNLLLSRQRAENLVSALVAAGISRERLSAHGMGETQLINNCANGVRCDNRLHLENRRVEVQVSGFTE